MKIISSATSSDLSYNTEIEFDADHDHDHAACQAVHEYILQSQRVRAALCRLHEIELLREDVLETLDTAAQRAELALEEEVALACSGNAAASAYFLRIPDVAYELTPHLRTATTEVKTTYD